MHDSFPDVLYVTHRVPYPPDKGDRIRTFHLLKFLSQYARVHLAALADERPDKEARNVLSRYCARFTIVPLDSVKYLRGIGSAMLGSSISEGIFRSPVLKKIIDGWTQTTHFSAAIASSSAVARYLRTSGLKQSLKVVDVVDVDSQKWRDYADRAWPPKSWILGLESRLLRNTESKICSWADAATLISNREAALMHQVSGNDKVFCVTNGVDLDYFRPTSVAESGCIFVGALNYRPNVDGIVWFAQTVWPHVRHHQPDAILKIVGRKPVQDIRDLAQIPGIDVVGQVPDIRPHLSQAALAVAPLRMARGLQNKVLEAMAAGKAVVASEAAVAGFGAGGLPALVANDVKEWVEAIVSLLANSGERARLGQAGRIYAETNHNWSTCLGDFGRLLRLPAFESVGGAP